MQACDVMQWHDERLDGPIKGEDFRRNPPTSPPWRQQSSNCGFERDHDDGGGNGKSSVGDLDRGGLSARSAGGTGTMVGEGDLLCAGGSGGSEGDDTVVLRSLEKVLAKQSAKQRRRPSKESSAARRALRDTIVACNSLAMSALGRGNTERCRDLLARAFEIASDRQLRGRGIDDGIHKEDNAGDNGGGGDPVLKVLTLNNTACFHRRLGEPKRALRCLRRAAELGRRSGGSEHLEVTHLNACAVLSELGRHEEALEHARSAVYYGQELEEAGTRAGAAERGGEACLSSSSGRGHGSRRARLATLAISYYNLAVELEYTHRYKACLRWYNEAVKLARDPDVHNEELIKTFQRSYAGARKKHAPPYQPSRSGCFRKAPVAGEATPSRLHEEKTPDGASLSPFRVLRPLDVDGPLFSDLADAVGSPGSSSIAHEVGSGQQRRMLREGGVGGFVRMQEHCRQADWPVFDRAERQRASDERRSNAWKHHSNSSSIRDDRDGVPQNMSQQSAVLSPNGNSQSDPLLQQQQPHSRHLRDGAFQAAANDTHNRPIGTTGRVRPAGSAASRGSGSDSAIPPKLSRKRPASADIVRERDRRVSGRIRLDRVSEASYEPAAAEPTRLQQQQQHQQFPRERCRRAVVQAPTESPRRKSGPGIVSAAAADVHQEGRRQIDCSRRPKSAYPRLEERGSRPDDSLGVGTGADGRSCASSSRVGRIRSLSARALKASASAASPSTSTLRNGWDRDCHSSREEGEGVHLAVTREGEENCGGEREEEEEREEVGRMAGRNVIDGSSPLRQGRGDVKMETTTKTMRAGKTSTRPHSDMGNVSANNHIGPASGQSNHAVPSLVSATKTDLSRRRKPSISSQQSAQSKPTSLPNDQATPVASASAPSPSSSSAAAAARARKSTKRPVIARSSPSRSRKGGSPHGSRQKKTNSAPANSSEQQRRRARDARPDNGRDGKLYVDVGTDERQRQKLTHLGSASDHNNVDPRFDNGRDGKLYVEPDNGRDGKLYRELEDDEEQSREALNEAQSLEAAPGINDVVANDTVRNRERLEIDDIGTAEEPIRQEKATEPLPPGRRAEAATAIQRAIAGAAIRRRSSGHGGGTKGTEKTLPEKDLLGPARGSRRVLSEQESDGAQREGKRISSANVATANSEVGAPESVVQKRHKLAREAANRHVLAASTIRAWAARACLARRLHRREYVRHDLKLRWEPEIQRIAATRIQAVARGAEGRRARWRAERAVVDIQRMERGWRGRSAVNELARTRLEKCRSSCEIIQRTFRGHRGRQKALRTRQIAWEETVARQGAAGVLQSAWRHRPKRRTLQEQQEQQAQRESATTLVMQIERDDSASLAASSMTPTAGAERNPSTEPPDEMPRQQLLRGAEAHGAVYAVWGAFTSLLTAAATRRVVRRAVEQALLAPAVATLAAFNRNCRNGVTTADLGSSMSSSSSPSRTRVAAVRPDPASFDCAPRFKRDMVVAVRRMTRTVLAQAGSLSGVRAAARGLSDGASYGGDGGDLGSGSSMEDDEGREGGRVVTEAVEDEAVALVSEVAEECWEFLSSSLSSPLAGADDGAVSERLTEILSETLQGLIGTLGRICSSPSHNESIVLPVALVRALASSATASLLSHPDVTDCVGLGRSEDGEEDDDGRDNEIYPGGRFNQEFGFVVAEVYCRFLSVSESGGCGTKNDQHAEKSDAEEESDAIGASARERQPPRFSPSPPPSPSFVQVRTNERLQFFRSFTELIHSTAEELMCGIGRSGWHYNDVVSRMASDLWEAARCGLMLSTVDDANEGEEEFSTPLPTTKQELRGGNNGVGLNTVDPTVDKIPATSSFPAIVGDGTTDTLSALLPSAGEKKKHPIVEDTGSSCSHRSTDAPSSRASEREGIPTIAIVDDSPTVVGRPIGSKAAAQPAQDDAVATPRTLKADACLSSSPIYLV